MTKGHFYKLLNREIKWCEEQVIYPYMSEEYRDGFVDGLKQAKQLIREMKCYDTRRSPEGV